MNTNVEVLEATAAFILADNQYVTLIRRAINSHGEAMQPVLTAAKKFEQIAEAKRKRAQAEAAMYAVWCRNGLGCDGEPQ